MKLTEEFFLMNKQRNRLKRFRKFDIIVNNVIEHLKIDFD